MSMQRRGPFDRLLGAGVEPEPQLSGRPDRAAMYVAGTIIGLALLLLILLLPPVSILSRGGGGGPSADAAPANASTIKATPKRGMPKLPAGLVAASEYYAMAAPQDQRGGARITVKLKEKPSDARSLGLYTYSDGKWQRLSDVTLVTVGEDTLGRGEVPALPGNIAILRRSKAALEIAGFVPAGTVVDGRAAQALTTLQPIVYIPAADGGLTGDSPAVPPASYRVVPCLITLVPEVVDDLLRSTELTNAHVAAIAAKVRDGNYAGIAVDYRSVSPALRKQFTLFATQLHDALAADGRTLTLVLPAPDMSSGDADEGAYDWEALGKVADTIEVVGEQDQELYFQRTEAALKYITGRVEPSKILITVNALSVERGSDGLRPMSLASALSIAASVSVKSPGDITAGARVPLVATNLADSEGASGLHWDDAARAVTMSYTGAGGRRTLWFSNAYSAAFRIELAQRYRLGGIVVDDASEAGGGADIWGVAQQAADTGAVTLAKPNAELLTPAWTTGDGALAPQTGAAVTWTAPTAAGSYSVTMIVSDGVVRVAQPVTLDVVP
jgi:hypothetical protein